MLAHSPLQTPFHYPTSPCGCIFGPSAAVCGEGAIYLAHLFQIVLSLRWSLDELLIDNKRYTSLLVLFPIIFSAKDQSGGNRIRVELEVIEVR